jgi:excisionase family DNA binding protein
MRFKVKKVERLLTSEEVCETLKISKPTLYRWIRRGWIRAVTLPGQRIRIPEEEIRKIVIIKEVEK